MQRPSSLKEIGFFFFVTINLTLAGMWDGGAVIRVTPNNGTKVFHCIEWDRLKSVVRWEEGSEEFPLKLELAVRTAKEYLSKNEQITNRLDLQTLEIKKLVVPLTRLKEHGLSLDDLHNQWILDLEFVVQHGLPGPRPLHFEHVLVRLDGGVVSQLRESIQSRKRTPDGITMRQSEGPTNFPVESGIVTNFDPHPIPYQRLYQPNAEAPDVSWPPDAAFPMELNDQVNRGRNLLDRDHLKQKLSLNSILVQRIRVGSLTSPETYRENDWRWLVTFYYGPKEIDKRSHVTVFLDGTVFDSANLAVER